jgi:hypothetical protein
MMTWSAFAAYKSNWRARMNSMLKLSIILIYCIDGVSLKQEKAHQKKMPIHESCSRSNTSDANFCLFGWSWTCLEHLKSHGAGDRPGASADIVSIDIVEIVKNITFRPHTGDTVYKKIDKLVMRKIS